VLELGESKVVVCIGRLSKEKGHGDLLDAIALLEKKRPRTNARFLIVGDGPEGHRLIAKCKRLGLDQTVHFAGFRKDIPAFYAIADLMVLPSHSEGSPNVVLEAMNAGVPIVATAAGGVPEILDGGKYGILVPVKDPPALAAALEKSLCDPALLKRLSTDARSRVIAEYSPDSYRRSMTDFYLEVRNAWHRVAGGTELG
jgi:glycosyltransferase involved in cell wall biosynthesis